MNTGTVESGKWKITKCAGRVVPCETHLGLQTGGLMEAKLRSSSRGGETGAPSSGVNWNKEYILLTALRFLRPT